MPHTPSFSRAQAFVSGYTVARTFLLLLVMSAAPGLNAAGLQLSSEAQEDPTTGRRDQRAVTVVEDALAAMGGAQAMAGVKTALVQGAASKSAAGLESTGTFVWTYRFGLRDSHEFRRAYTSNTGTRILVSGTEQPRQSLGGEERAYQPHVRYSMQPYHLPGVMLASKLADPAYSVTF